MLHLARAGAEQLRVFLDGNLHTTVTKDDLGSGEGSDLGGVEHPPLGDLAPGEHQLNFDFTEDDGGNGRFAWDALALTRTNLVVDNDLVECPNTAFTSIQAAINAASPGDRINVCEGTYAEQLVLDKPDIRITGAGGKKSIVSVPGGNGLKLEDGADGADVRFMGFDGLAGGSGAPVTRTT